ncbi:hypothetical protein [Erwinia pyrifoliae]|uniref:Uncharacterized protein n=1 Tax=Erwinia pyrifoliae TaxID=79967 RepID=A0ABY5XD07_ERWPY|nr:hypothetical protein [Erwinia pyrifoliae]UWS35000.1 hypothetical protein NYP84_07615 [Erwinia pyrifoliae]
MPDVIAAPLPALTPVAFATSAKTAVMRQPGTPVIQQKFCASKMDDENTRVERQ